MTQPATLAEAHAYAQRNPLRETVLATLALSQCILGRSTANDPGLRAGMVAAFRARLREAYGG